MIRRISELFGSQLRMLTAAVAGAIALAGCATAPTDEAAATATGGTAAASATPSNGRAGQASGPGAKPAPIVSSTAPTKTVTLPDKGRVSLAEYRTQMREQLMKSENASSNVADCAAHASWVVPRSASYDALKIPTGALSSEQATVEPWNGRFSAGKQAVPVTSVVTFSATAHKRRGEAQWQPVKVRCGYDDSMMLAYELLDSNGDTISEAAAAPAVATPASSHSSSTKGKGKSKGKSSAKSTSSKSTSSAKSTTSSSSSSSSSKSKKKQ